MNNIKHTALLGCGILVVALFLSSCFSTDPTSDEDSESVVPVTPSPSPAPVISSESDGLITISPVLAEDYLPNPGIGWQHDPEEDDFKYLPETVAYSDRKLIGWKILNPEDGIYNWSALDEQLSQAVEDGKQFSFRVYTMRGESYGGHYVPDWVLEKGATLLNSGEPDYSNCRYQEEWGRFVNELIDRYDGNRNIAFIDISGYGDFSEWSWRDDQTMWDELWEKSYLEGVATPTTMTTLDSQARRRIADMFIGGAVEAHNCRDSEGNTRVLSYSYSGFQDTQLLMPYAGIAQSTEYVFSRRTDVGFRFDCLGTDTDRIVERLEKEISVIWKNAPIVFEFCTPGRFELGLADDTLHSFHGSLVHNNSYSQNRKLLESVMVRAGYRYFLKQAEIQIQDENRLELAMEWQNVGIAPNYPKVGQTFQMNFYLVGVNNRETIEFPISADISAWLPALSDQTSPPVNQIATVLDLPNDLAPGIYEARISIIEKRTGNPIRLPFSQSDDLGRYFLTNITISSN